MGLGGLPRRVLLRQPKQTPAALEGFEKGGLFQAANAPEAIVAGEVVEAARDELENGNLTRLENCGTGRPL